MYVYVAIETGAATSTSLCCDLLSAPGNFRYKKVSVSPVSLWLIVFSGTFISPLRSRYSSGPEHSFISSSLFSSPYFISVLVYLLGSNSFPGVYVTCVSCNCRKRMSATTTVNWCRPWMDVRRQMWLLLLVAELLYFDMSHNIHSNSPIPWWYEANSTPLHKIKHTSAAKTPRTEGPNQQRWPLADLCKHV